MNDYTEMSTLDMRLPEGKTCGDCIHCTRCTRLFGCVKYNSVCDWLPSRFAEKEKEVEK